MKKSKTYPFYEYNIVLKKRGVCHICGAELYYGVGVIRPTRGDFDICKDCCKEIKEIYERIY